MYQHRPCREGSQGLSRFHRLDTTDRGPAACQRPLRRLFNVQIISSTAQAYSPCTSPSCTTASSVPKIRPLSVKIRPGREADVGVVADLCAQTFAYGTYGINVAELESAPLRRVLGALEQRYEVSIQKELRKQLRSSLAKKRQAEAAAREWRAWRQVAQLRAQLARLNGRASAYASPPTDAERQQLAKWERARRFVMFVAEDVATRQLLGCAFVSMTVAEAVLPPPFPTSKPQRMYVSNIAVADTVRRRGVATALLTACERLGRRWHQESVWLHMDADNPGARRLYEGCGYRQQPVARWRALDGRRLMAKQLPPLKRRGDARQADEAVAVTGSTGEDGVFVWRSVQAEAERDGQD